MTSIPFSSDQERLRALGKALNAVAKRTRAQVGAEDVQRVRRLNRLSRSSEAVGRLLIHFSFEPVTWGAGVVALWAHKQLQTTEIGHPALHGCYDGLEGAEGFQSDTFRWDIAIDEEAWDRGHNRRHHAFTNVELLDPDTEFGPVRLNDTIPHRTVHYWQIPYTLLFLWPNFAFGMNTHFTGLVDVIGNRHGTILPDQSSETVRGAVRQFLRKAAPYYAKEFVFYPALAGPLWWKVAAGNWAAGTLRNIYTAASIMVGHVGDDVDRYPEGTRPHGRGEWLQMQIRASQNFQVPYALSVLCGGLDYQIEHHLFPDLPPERLRQIAPEVRQICEDHEVPYKTGSWPRMLGDAFQQLWRLSFPTPEPCPAGR